MGLGHKAGQPLSLKGMDSFPDTLVAAVQLGGNLLRGLLLVAGQEDLAAAQGEGIGGA
jgi:hypothetical protein